MLRVMSDQPCSNLLSAPGSSLHLYNNAYILGILASRTSVAAYELRIAAHLSGLVHDPLGADADDVALAAAKACSMR
jgi:hypothetical protein